MEIEIILSVLKCVYIYQILIEYPTSLANTE